MTIRVVRNQQQPMRYEIHIGESTLVIDMSSEGGEASGPTPHDLYDAALGACMAMTVLWYSTHKHIAVEGIEVSLDRDATQEHAGIYRLSTALAVTGELNAAQRDYERCGTVPCIDS
ncbi:MAG TPA: OsmC family protein [Steroidobacteraceae bacterium]|nr:OsmC family protein [Steroidobacteraceae bacterium]